MFSTKEKQKIADQVQFILQRTGHPELPTGEIEFMLHVKGATPMSWADIHNNGMPTKGEPNPHNEQVAEEYCHPYCPKCGHNYFDLPKTLKSEAKGALCVWCLAEEKGEL